MSFDQEFELDIVAAAARDSRYRKRVKRIIGKVNPWTLQALGDIWGIVSKLEDDDRLTGSIVAKFIDDVEDDDEAEEILAVAGEVFSHIPSAPGYAATELATWIQKEVITQGASKLIDKLGNDDVDGAEQLIQEMSRVRSGLHRGVEGGDWFTGFDTRQKVRLEEKKNPKLRPVIRTRIDSLDKKLMGGIRKEEFGLIVGFTNVGKSFFAQNFAFVAAALGFLTLYISTEMSKRLCDTRFDSRFFRRDSADFYEHNFDNADLDEFERRQDRLRSTLEGMLHSYSTPMNSLSKAGIEEILDDIEDECGREVDLLVMDSADHMVPMVPIREKRLQQSAVYWDIKSLIAERKLACWSTCHAPGNFKSLLTEFDQSESKEKGKIASKIITLNQTKKEHRKDIIRVYVAKNRAGQKGSLHWVETDYARASFTEVDPPSDENDEDEDEEEDDE